MERNYNNNLEIKESEVAEMNNVLNVVKNNNERGNEEMNNFEVFDTEILHTASFKISVNEGEDGYTVTVIPEYLYFYEKYRLNVYVKNSYDRRAIRCAEYATEVFDTVEDFQDYVDKNIKPNLNSIFEKYFEIEERKIFADYYEEDFDWCVE